MFWFFGLNFKQIKPKKIDPKKIKSAPNYFLKFQKYHLGSIFDGLSEVIFFSLDYFWSKNNPLGIV